MKAKYIITICLLMIVFISCDKDFLECPPLTEASSVTFFKNASEATMAVNGVYNSLYLYNYIFEWEDALTDNETWNEEGGTWTYGGLANYAETAAGNNAYTYRMWGKGYRTIQRANTAIEGISAMDASLIDDDTRNVLIAECRFLRAWQYHLLAWRFGGVPILLDPVGEQELTPARNTKEEVVQQIIDDYTFASQHLPDTWSGNDLGRAHKGAALGMLAEEYLWNKQWANAANAAKQVIDNSNYGLLDNYQDLFTPGINNTKEDLFGVQYWTANGAYGSYYRYRWFRAPASNTARAGYEFHLALQDLVNEFENSDGTPFDPTGIDVTTDDSQYENRDPRLWSTVFYNGADIYGQPYNRSWSRTGYAWRKYSCSKNDPLLVGSSIPMNWKVMRYAEVLLFYAEAKNETDGPTQDVYNAINQVRSRVGMPDLPTGLTKDEMRERIYHERRVEFASEGVHLEDLIRWRRLEVVENRHLSAGCTYHTDFEEFEYLWPIPQTEIDVNPNLEQNPGY